jgi:nitrogen-specific signal transduction histidine kinase
MINNPKRSKRGGKRPGAGRKPGSPNRAARNARAAIARFIDANVDRLQGWLDRIAEEQGPLAAAKLFVDLVEYHVPKLARTEIANADSKPFKVDATISPVEAYARAINP